MCYSQSPRSSPVTVCCATLSRSQKVEPREAHVPAWDPASWSGLPSFAGFKPLVGPHLLAPQGLPSMWGVGSEAQNVQIPKAQRERESLHQAPKSHTKGPCTKRAMSPNVLQKSRGLQLRILGHSSAPSIPPVSVLHQLCRHFCCRLLQADLLADFQTDPRNSW